MENLSLIDRFVLWLHARFPPSKAEMVEVHMIMEAALMKKGWTYKEAVNWIENDIPPHKSDK